eukprot:3286186-Amphidinium_carterae.1
MDHDSSLGKEGMEVLQCFMPQSSQLQYVRHAFFQHWYVARRDIYTNIDRKDYNVNEFYKESGCCTYIANADWSALCTWQSIHDASMDTFIFF